MGKMLVNKENKLFDLVIKVKFNWFNSKTQKVYSLYGF